VRHYFRRSPNNARKVNSAGASPTHRVRNHLPLRIPFHQAFRHALQNREESDAVIVKVTGSDGRSGFGESLPRSYVTEKPRTPWSRVFATTWRQNSFVKTFAPDGKLLNTCKR